MSRSTHDRLRDRLNDINRPLKRSYRPDEVGPLLSALTSNILLVVSEEIDALRKENAELKAKLRSRKP